MTTFLNFCLTHDAGVKCRLGQTLCLTSICAGYVIKVGFAHTLHQSSHNCLAVSASRKRERAGEATAGRPQRKNVKGIVDRLSLVKSTYFVAHLLGLFLCRHLPAPLITSALVVSRASSSSSLPKIVPILPTASLHPPPPLPHIASTRSLNPAGLQRQYFPPRNLSQSAWCPNE